MKRNYSEKLKDPRWQKRRLEILKTDNWVCGICSDSNKELHVHHRNYEKNLEPWEYPDDLLITLCKTCHENVESLSKRLRRSASFRRQYFIFSRGIDLIESESDDFLELITHLSERPWLVPLLVQILEDKP